MEPVLEQVLHGAIWPGAKTTKRIWMASYAPATGLKVSHVADLVATPLNGGPLPARPSQSRPPPSATAGACCREHRQIVWQSRRPRKARACGSWSWSSPGPNNHGRPADCCRARQAPKCRPSSATWSRGPSAPFRSKMVHPPRKSL